MCTSKDDKVILVCYVRNIMNFYKTKSRSNMNVLHISKQLK